MTARYVFRTRSRWIVGPDALAQLDREFRRLGAGRVLVVASPSAARAEVVRALLEPAWAGRTVAWFDGVVPDSPRSVVERARDLVMDFRPDAVLALGGGSAMVTARAAVILAGEGRPVEDLATRYPPGRPPESPRLLAPKIPFVAVMSTPSVAATAPGAAVRDDATGRRYELFDPECRPTAVLVDPRVLLTAPEARYRATAVATLAMAVGLLEAPAIRVNAPARADLAEAVRLLRAGVGRPGLDAADRVALAEAALLVSRARDAQIGTGGGLAMGIAHQLHNRWGVEHTAAVTSLLPASLAYNRPVTEVQQGFIAELFGGRPGEDPAPLVAAALREAGYARRLADLGVPRDLLPAVAEAALGDWFVRSNVRPVERMDDVLSVLEAAY
ncbi:MAG: iron-containing alcohol dehydrogenase [Actinomycetia bacterium]|nr:iron-containing alcohol dehydrogenase [Actinomycetes bacterium]